ncbi:peptidoglycan-binding protein [Streptomyces sp. NPDC012888]|uniref:peptidoglycan-binding domain-containing protein n=1 Tax=Streptomyces sp. NPDC012888 TaxID=3364855 RepID=UPI0036CA4DBB
MSAERCPDCGAARAANGTAGTACACARGTGYDPLRIRPYVTRPAAAPPPPAGMPWQDPATEPLPPTPPGQVPPAPFPADPFPADPFAPGPFAPGPVADGQVTPAPYSRPSGPGPDAPGAHGGADTPAYGMPMAVRLGAAPDGGNRKSRRARPAGGNRLPLLAGAAAVVVIGATAALVIGLPDGDGRSDTALPDPTLSAPAVSVAPVGPTASSDGTDGGRPSPAVSPKAAASGSGSVSASASAAATRGVSGPADPSPSRPGRDGSPPAGSGPSGRPPSSSQTGVLRRGDTGPDVEQLQRDLQYLGLLWNGRVDGRYGKHTEDAVARFQAEEGITSDARGVFGPETRRALTEAVADGG